jgi:hypothetical protein
MCVSYSHSGSETTQTTLTWPETTHAHPTHQLLVGNH